MLKSDPALLGPDYAREGTAQLELLILTRYDQFTVAVLTDGDGLPLAASTRHQKREQADMLAAVAPLVLRMVQRSNERAGLSAANEVVVHNDDRTRLVCRFFESRHQQFILACLIPDNVPHSRAVKRAVRAIQKLWAE